jgi:integrase
MLQQGESLIYVQRQLGHASINLTADTYGKWLPWAIKRPWIGWMLPVFLEVVAKW